MDEDHIPVKIEEVTNSSFRNKWKHWRNLFIGPMEKWKHYKYHYLPSVMTQGKEIELANRYHEREPHSLDYVASAITLHIVTQNFAKIVRPTKVLTLLAALEKMEPKTSPGILLKEFCSTLEGSGKKEVLLSMMDEIELLVSLIDAGLLPIAVFSSWLKNELLPKIKVIVEKKCRLFMAGPAEHILISHTLFAEQNKCMYENCWPKSWVGIGINKFYGFFPLIRRSMLAELKLNPQLIVASIDGKRHDASCHVKEFEDVAYIRSTRIMDSQKYMNRIKYVYRNITKTFTLTADGTVLQVDGGNKSGQGNTTTDNCIIQFQRFMGYLVRNRREDVINQVCGEYPPLIILGDDILCWSSLLTSMDYINMAHYIRCEYKATWIVKLGDINNWEFCSHSPTKSSDYRLAAIPEDKIVSGLYRTTTLTTNAERLQGELMESYPRKLLFDDLYDFAVPYLSKLGIALQNKDWYHHLWYGYETIGVTELNLKSPDKKNSNNLRPFYDKLFRSETPLPTTMSKKTKNSIQQRNHVFKCSPTIDEVKHMVGCIMDPETHGVERYPDTFFEETALLKGITNIQIPVMVQSASFVDPGDFFCEVHPEISKQVVYLVEDRTGDQVSAIISQNTNNFGIYPQGSRLAPEGPILITTEDQVFDIILPMETDDGAPQLPMFLTREDGVDSDGYYYPGGAFNFGNGTGFEIAGRNVDNTAVTIDLDVVDVNGITHSATSITVAARTDFILHSAVFNLLEGRAVFKATMRITNTTGPTPKVHIDYVTFDYSLGRNGYRTASTPSSSILVTDAQKYRVNQMTGWLQYQGPSLTDGGQASGVLQKGGRPSFFSRMFQFETIANHPDSYSGVVKKGIYGWWAPNDTVDMSFRSTNAVNIFRRPSLVYAGTYSGPADGSPILNPESILRLRVVTGYEYTSVEQILPTSPPPICPKLIELSALILSGEVNVMENNKHWGKVKSVLSKIAKTAAIVGKFGWDHRDILEKLAAEAMLLA